MVFDLQLLLLVYNNVENVEVLLIQLVNCRLGVFLKLMLTLFQYCHFFLVVMGGLLCFRAPHSCDTVHMFALAILGFLQLSTATRSTFSQKPLSNQVNFVFQLGLFRDQFLSFFLKFYIRFRNFSRSVLALNMGSFFVHLFKITDFLKRWEI